VAGEQPASYTGPGGLGQGAVQWASDAKRRQVKGGQRESQAVEVSPLTRRGWGTTLTVGWLQRSPVVKRSSAVVESRKSSRVKRQFSGQAKSQCPRREVSVSEGVKWFNGGQAVEFLSHTSWLGDNVNGGRRVVKRKSSGQAKFQWSSEVQVVNAKAKGV